MTLILNVSGPNYGSHTFWPIGRGKKTHCVSVGGSILLAWLLQCVCRCVLGVQSGQQRLISYISHHLRTSLEEKAPRCLCALSTLRLRRLTFHTGSTEKNWDSLFYRCGGGPQQHSPCSIHLSLHRGTCVRRPMLLFIYITFIKKGVLATEIHIEPKWCQRHVQHLQRE